MNNLYEDRFYDLERAFRTGWKEVYDLTDRYFNDVQDEHLSLLREVTKELHEDPSCLSSESWGHKFDETDTLVTRMVGMSRLKMFICIPEYENNEISQFGEAEEAYEAGRRAAFDKLADVCERSSRSKTTCDDAELIMEGAMSLLSEVASKTGYKIVSNDQGGNEDENANA